MQVMMIKEIKKKPYFSAFFHLIITSQLVGNSGYAAADKTAASFLLFVT